MSCLESSEREKYDALKSVLKSRFALKETTQSLGGQLHTHVQQEGESLAEYSSALVRLYDRMEKAALPEEKNAICKLRDNTLKERFVQGIRDKQVKWEVRRTAIAHDSKEGSAQPLPG